jgi:predicted CXXCH cytochrome family protein
MAETQTRLLLFVLGIAAVATLIMFVGMNESSNNDFEPFNDMQIEENDEITYDEADESSDYDITVKGTRADGGKYEGVDTCKICHSDMYDGWSETGHGKDFTPSSGIRPAINTYAIDGQGPEMPGSCALCHAVGVGNTENGGFDMDEPWDSNTPTADQKVGNSKLIGIQCESCHGPGSDHAGSQDGADIIGNPSVEESCMADGDSGCHGPEPGHDKYTVWKASAHSNQDQLDTENAGGSPRGMNSACAQCKSPSQYEPDLETPVEYTAAEWHGIGCADCHDPHSDEFDHQLRTEVEDACTVCHTNAKDGAEPGGSPHHTQKEAFGGYMAFGVSGQKGMAGVTCVDCHMWESPEISHGYYMNDAIGSDHEESHDFEAKAEACADCHSDLVARMPDGKRPANNTGENEELWDEWDDWGMEWNETVEMWEMVIHDWQENYEVLFESVEHNYETAEQALVDAKANGTASPETIEEAELLLGKAIWNIHLSDDGSMGVHNPDFFTDLLNYANVNSNEALEMLHANGAPIANAGLSQLVDAGDEASFDGSASTDLDGTIANYLWDFGDGNNGTTETATHTYPTAGTYLVTLMVTDNAGEMDWDMITVFVVPPVDLDDIEEDIDEIMADTASIKENLTAGSDDQSAENKDDIDDLDSKIGSRTAMLGAGIMVVLLIALVLGYHGMETVKAEIKKNKDEEK